MTLAIDLESDHKQSKLLRSQQIYFENCVQRSFLFYSVIVVVFMFALNARVVEQIALIFIFFMVLVPVVLHLQLLKFINSQESVSSNWMILFALIDSFCIGMSISMINFSIVPSVVFFGLLVVSLTHLSQIFPWILAFVFTSLGMFGVATILDYTVLNFQQTPLDVSVVAIGMLIAFILFEFYAKNKLIDGYDEQLLCEHEALQRQIRITNRVARYAPIQVWEPIVNGSEVRIENRRKKLTVFFSDIEGFTQTSERLSPDDLAEFLNTYFEEMTTIAHQYGGTVDKFMGDGLLIFFGDTNSESPEKDAIKCVDMAIAMRRKIQTLKQQTNKIGFGHLNVRMAMSSGYCHVGNFGTPARISYTVLGPDVNLAARLQGECQENEILVSNSTYMLIRSFFVGTKRGNLILKGIRQPVEAWSIIDRFEHAVDYRKRWYEFNLKGFFLQLDLQALASSERSNIVKALKETTDLIDKSRIQKP